MAGEVELVTVPNVHLCSVGRWLVAQGPELDPVTGHPVWNVTPEDLAAIVEAADDPGIRTAIVKLGHHDTLSQIEMPAVGRIENLHTENEGMDLYGDLVGVPKWLAQAMPSAYPDRSVEVSMNYAGSTGHTHAAVLTALALLGETTPAIESLEDVFDLYAGNYEELVAAATAAGAHAVVLLTKEAPVPKPILASVSMDQVRQSFYEKLPSGSWAWIREVWSDFLIVDDDEGALYRVPWAEANGEVTFGDPIQVVVEYVEAPASAPADQGIMLGRSAGEGPRLSVRASSNPEGGVGMTKDQLAAIGLPEDATEEAISEKLVELAARPEAPAPEDKPTPAVTSLPEGTVAIDADALAELQANAQAGRDAHRTIAERDRDVALTAAVQAGKFPPARKDHWKALWEKDPEGTRSTIDALASGLVPVGAGEGHADSIEDASDDAIWAALGLDATTGSEG